MAGPEEIERAFWEAHRRMEEIFTPITTEEEPVSRREQHEQHLRDAGWVTNPDDRRRWAHSYKTGGLWVGLQEAFERQQLSEVEPEYRRPTPKQDEPVADPEASLLLRAGWLPLVKRDGSQTWMHPELSPTGIPREEALRKLAPRPGGGPPKPGERFRDRLEDMAREDDVLQALADEPEPLMVMGYGPFLILLAAAAVAGWLLGRRG